MMYLRSLNYNAYIIITSVQNCYYYHYYYIHVYRADVSSVPSSSSGIIDNASLLEAIQLN